MTPGRNDSRFRWARLVALVIAVGLGCAVSVVLTVFISIAVIGGFPRPPLKADQVVGIWESAEHPGSITFNDDGTFFARGLPAIGDRNALSGTGSCSIDSDGSITLVADRSERYGVILTPHTSVFGETVITFFRGFPETFYDYRRID